MTDTITIPRSVLEALVDPRKRLYLTDPTHYFAQCRHCGALINLDDSHTADCPVRLAQEALANKEHKQ